MSAEPSWGADAVAFGRGAPDGGDAEKPRRSLAPGPKPPRSPRVLVLVALAIVVVPFLVASIVGGAGSPESPIREAANPAPRVIDRPRRIARHEPGPVARARSKRKAKGKLEEMEREPPRASATTHELAEDDATELELEPPPAPSPPPPAPSPAPATASPAPPTSAVTEFGL